MKKITLLFILMFSALGFAQQQQYNLNFEPSTPSGNLSNWATFENPNPVAQIITNPDPDGVNTSTTTNVLKLSATQSSACYAGAINFHGTLGTWQLNSAVPSNLTLSMKVNKNVPGKVGIKFVNATNGTVFEITDNQGLVTTTNQWVTLTWNIAGFNVGDNINIDQVVVFIDFTCGGPNRTSAVELLVDDITWGANRLTSPATCTDGIQNGSETGIDCGGSVCSPCPGQEPMVAAPTPPARNAGDVVSIFSNAYSNVALSELPTGWSQLSSFTPIQITGDDTWKMLGCEFLGIVTNYATGVDLSTMQKIHIDYWTPSANPISVKIVNTVNAPVTEAIAPLGPVVTGSWQSIDLNMSAFTGNLVDKTKITQLLIDPSAPSTLFIDNFYFYKGLPLNTNNFSSSNFRVYPNPVRNILNLSNSTIINSIEIYNTLGQVVSKQASSTNEVAVDVSSLSKGVYILTAQVGDELVRKQFIKE